jgi:hypothetical protein
MKASSLFVASLAVAITSIAPANAEDCRCTTTTWPGFSAAPCGCARTQKVSSYAECTTAGMKTGARGPEVWWYCSGQGFKK